jgi:hypothetical protein
MEVLFSVPAPPAAADKPAGQDATGKKPDAAKEPGEATPKAAVAKSDADGLEQCLRDWDRGTHMTRQEWARTCRRVATNRAKFLREQVGK